MLTAIGEDDVDVLFRVGVHADDVGECFGDGLRDDGHAAEVIFHFSRMGDAAGCGRYQSGREVTVGATL